MLISPAWAQDGGGFGGMEQLLPLVLIFVVFWFLLIRPQQKKAKAHREMIGNLRRGDRIVTNGGLIGTITRVPNERELIVQIAEDTKVRIMRGMIAESLSGDEQDGKGARRPPDDYDDDDEEDGGSGNRKRDKITDESGRD